MKSKETGYKELSRGEIDKAGQQHLLLIGKDLRQYVLAESGFEHLFSGSEPLAS
jgi:hypothetical protein